MKIERKKVEESMVEMPHIVRPTHLNASGRLYGGMLLQWIDEVAAIVARRHCKEKTVTATIDNLRFINGAYQNDTVILMGKITWVGKTSMEIRVDTITEKLNGDRKLINTAYLVMVALDEENHGIEVPGLVISSEEEQLEWEAGMKRRQMRIQRREEGY